MKETFPEQNTRVERIRSMEAVFDRVQAVLNSAADNPALVSDISAEAAQLSEYYESPLWKEDFETDEAGALPPDLKRGVLSEDGIYNLLETYNEILSSITVNYEIRELQGSDYAAARRLAENIFRDCKCAKIGLSVSLSAGSYWYGKLYGASEAYAAFSGGELCGVLLSVMKNGPAKYRKAGVSARAFLYGLYRCIFAGSPAGAVSKTEKELLGSLNGGYSPEGEIVLFGTSADDADHTDCLLSELEKSGKGKQVYAFALSESMSRFFESRGFTLMGSRDVFRDAGNEKAPLQCRLYSKTLQAD